MSQVQDFQTKLYEITSRRRGQILAPGETFDILEVYNWIQVESGQNIELFINGNPPGIIQEERTGFRIPSYEGLRFTKIKNADPLLTQNVVIKYGIGDVIDNRLSGTVNVITPPGSGLQLAKPASSVAIVYPVALVPVQIAAANLNRYSFSIEAGTADLYIGSTAAEALANGFLVEADSTYVLESKDAVWAVRIVAVQNAYTREESY